MSPGRWKGSRLIKNFFDHEEASSSGTLTARGCGAAEEGGRLQGGFRNLGKFLGSRGGMKGIYLGKRMPIGMK